MRVASELFQQPTINELLIIAVVANPDVNRHVIIRQHFSL